MRYLIVHETVLRFPRPVREHQCELRLAPREDAAQRRIACEIEVEPAAPLRTHHDCFGNLVHRLSLLPPHDGLRARVRALVETRLANPFDYAPVPPAEERAWLERAVREDPSLHDFVLHRSAAVPELAGILDACDPPPFDDSQALVANVQAAMRWARATFAYEPGSTRVHGALAELGVKRAGVCQDFAHLLVALVRSWGFAARYVMGYVDPGTVAESAQELEATHAWAEVLIPGAGWRGFDATSGLVANDAYVPVAVGRDSRDAAPVRGTFKGDHGGDPPRVSVRLERQAAEEQQVQ